MAGRTNRTGRVSAINYERGTYTVTFPDRDGTVTREINAYSNGEYRMPAVGQVVGVSLNDNGSAAGVTQGSVWNKTNSPAKGYKGYFRKEYSNTQGQCYDEYDANTGQYTSFCDGRAGRNAKGEIYDESRGPITHAADGPLSLISKGASVGINAATGVGISAGAAVDITAGTYASIEAGGEVSIGAGTKMTVTTGGTKTSNIGGAETYTNKAAYTRECKTSRKLTVAALDTETYHGKRNITQKGDVTRTTEADVTRKLTGDLTDTVEGNVTQELTGNLTQTVTGDVTQTVEGNVLLTVGGTTVEVAASGDVTITTTKASVTAAEVTVEAGTGDIKVDGISLCHHKHKDGGSGEPEK